MLLSHVAPARSAASTLSNVPVLVAAPPAATGGAALHVELTVRNRLLAALPADELALILPHLRAVQLEQREPLFVPGGPIRHVYFPDTAVVSLVNELTHGGGVEVGTAGYEGMAGLSVFLDDDEAPVRAVVQVPGAARRMDAAVFQKLACAPGEFHRLLLRYTQAFLGLVAQTAACNGVHLVAERCARWVLMMHDRVAGDQFPLAPEFVARLLAMRRTGATAAMRTLQAAELVEYSGGIVTILDRAGLESASCECYRVVRWEYERLLPARWGGD